MRNYLMLFLLLISSMLFGGNDSLTCLAVFKPFPTGVGDDDVVRCNGDFNGDGYKDFIIVRPDDQPDNTFFQIFYGGVTADTIPDLIFKKPAVQGVSLALWSINAALEGDYNGDGYSDLAIGLPYANSNYAFDCGAVLIYYGSANPDSLPGCVMIGNGNGLHYGNGLTVGDYNGDGFSDLAVSGDGPDYYLTGKIGVYYGQANLSAGVSWAAGWTKTGQPLEKIGQDLASSNFNGDNCADLLSIKNYGDSYKKTIVIYKGDNAGLNSQSTWELENVNCNKPTIDCDFNNDGKKDLFFTNDSMTAYSGNDIEFLRFENKNKNINFMGIVSIYKNDENSFDDLMTDTFNDNIHGYYKVTHNNSFNLFDYDTLRFCFSMFRYWISDINNDGYTEFLSRKANSSYYALCSTKPVTNDIDSPGIVTDATFFTYPNPFNNTTLINYHQHVNGLLNLSVYNAKGELVKNIYNGYRLKGEYSTAFNANGLNSGIYFVKLQTPSSTVMQKIILLK